ncbi:hypothetical protein [Azospirillum rugosum]|uniref:Uncharacterized protein n=1 Tax=Azospirillum rugosum TaxID=416170 RepID=A0ABS4STA0_9PROT|nr:hypothetical protein [Azospirillum rugosum]MBP2295802.1 hypothetical protein [Azospirillum rugosum]MDQ0529087.1 hypothetical protein [Azospirillum rugosum]
MIRAALSAGVLLLGWMGSALAQCRTVEITANGRPVVGIEDLAVDGAFRRVLLSAYDRRAEPDASRGGLFAVPLDALDADRAEAVELTAAFRPVGVFRPHGIDLRTEADGRRSVLAVNRRRDGTTTVERFTLDGAALRHQGTVESPLLCRANDVAFLDGERFLFTGDHGGCGRAAAALEDALDLRRGVVGLVENSAARVLAGGLGYPNGLLPDFEADRLYVAATREGAVLVYRLSALLGGGETAPMARIPVPGGPDNLSRGTGGGPLEGRALAAVHPSLPALALHRHGLPGGATAPARVVALFSTTMGPAGVETLFDDDGGLFSAATVAAAWDGRLIAGSVMSARLLTCGTATSGASRSSGWAARSAPTRP